MGKVKRQHYVPVFYLNGFTNANNKIFVYDKAKEKVFETGVENIACEHSFYDSDIFKSDFIEEQYIEKSYSYIESEFAPFLLGFINKIESKDKFEISNEEKNTISNFLAFQIERTKEYREILMQLSCSMKDKLKERGITDEQLLNMGFDFNNLDPKELHLDSIVNGGDMREILSETLKKHILILVVNNTNKPFYTSDNPIVKIANIIDDYVSYSGFASKGIEIIFPLNSKYLLVFCEREYFKELEVFENKMLHSSDVEHISYYNSHEVTGSFRQIYSSEKNFDIITELKNKYPENFDINRIRII